MRKTDPSTQLPTLRQTPFNEALRGRIKPIHCLEVARGYAYHHSRRLYLKLMDAQHGQRVRQMFTRIAPHYDLMNRLMTLGQDRSWRREVIKLAQLEEKSRVLDLGTGTGDLAMIAARGAPHIQVLAADFNLDMMKIAQQRLRRSLQSNSGVDWCACDALYLPFSPGMFDAVVSAFLLRNVGDLAKCLLEQYRVLKPGGRFVALDTTPPQRGVHTPLMNLYLFHLIPWLGKRIAGDEEAYRYLPHTTKGFLPAEQLAAKLREVGFLHVKHRKFMFGSIAIHWGVKPQGV